MEEAVYNSTMSSKKAKKKNKKTGALGKRQTLAQMLEQ
jgi:hypothetical protein